MVALVPVFLAVNQDVPAGSSYMQIVLFLSLAAFGLVLGQFWLSRLLPQSVAKTRAGRCASLAQNCRVLRRRVPAHPSGLDDRPPLLGPGVRPHRQSAPHAAGARPAPGRRGLGGDGAAGHSVNRLAGASVRRAGVFSTVCSRRALPDWQPGTWWRWAGTATPPCPSSGSCWRAAPSGRC